MSEETQSARGTIVADLVSAMLAVNLWTVDKMFSIHEGLEREGLFEHERIAEAEYSDVHAKLVAAGYARGDYIVSLLTERLQSMAQHLCSGGLDRLAGLLERPGPELDEFLLQINHSHYSHRPIRLNTHITATQFSSVICARIPRFHKRDLQRCSAITSGSLSSR